MVGSRMTSTLLALALLGLGAGWTKDTLAAQSPPAQPAGTKMAILKISGMTCFKCSGAIRQSLSQVKGVQKAVVSLGGKEARVTYDPKQTSPQKLVEAVKQTHGMGPYSATVKKP
jgi:copper chaperone CopZ